LTYLSFLGCHKRPPPRNHESTYVLLWTCTYLVIPCNTDIGGSTGTRWSQTSLCVVKNMVGSVEEKTAGSSNSSYLESIPDDVFNNIVSRLDTSSLFALEASRALRHRVSMMTRFQNRTDDPGPGGRHSDVPPPPSSSPPH
jgi:hypothetical protein